MSTYQFDEQERDRIRSEFKAIGNLPLPPNRKNIGCGLLLLVPPLLMFGPRVGRTFGIALALLCAIVALTGAYLTLFGGSAELNTIRARAASGLKRLAEDFDDLTPDERRTAALYALVYARYSAGPATFDVYDAALEGEKLGPALEYVRAVEQVLVDASLVHHVFTY